MLFGDIIVFSKRYAMHHVLQCITFFKTPSSRYKILQWVLHIQQIGLCGIGRASSLVASVGNIEHFSFDIVYEILSSSDRGKDDREFWTEKKAKTIRPLWFPGRSWPEKEWCARYRRHHRNSVVWVAQESTVWPDRRKLQKATGSRWCGNPTDGNNFVKGNVDLNVSDPKPEGSIVCDFNRSNVIVPKPSDSKKICNCHGYYCSVHSIWQCADNKQKEQNFYNGKSSLEAYHQHGKSFVFALFSKMKRKSMESTMEIIVTTT